MSVHAYMTAARACCRSRRGATAIEYALIGALIALAVVVGATSIGGTLDSTFDSVKEPFADGGDG